MKILVTGASGAVGTYFIKYLQDLKFPKEDVLLMGRKYLTFTEKKYKVLEIDEDWKPSYRPLGYPLKGENYFTPDIIFNFASNTDVAGSFNDPRILYDNIGIVQGVLDWMPEGCRLFHVSTSEVYGNNPSGIPIKVTYPLNPLNPYAISKVVQEYLCNYHHKLGKNIIIVRSFGYINPLRDNLFSTQVVDSILKREPVRVGNTSSVRSFMHVKDIVKCYYRMAKTWPSGVYNLGDIYPISVNDFIIKIMEHTGCESFIVDRDKYRPTDVTNIYPDMDDSSSLPPIEYHNRKDMIEDLFNTRKKLLGDS